MTIQILPKPFDPEAELAAFRRRCAGAGAIASFIGCVRQDPGVRALILEDYPALTERSIREFAERAVERFALEGVAIVHRVGEMDPGEPIVFVACASAHRKNALAAVDYLMDFLKSEAPFWKREVGAEGERWIEPRADDYAAAAQWREQPKKGARS